MSELIVTPGRICGELNAQGSKNSVLPLLAASLVTDDEVIIRGCPRLADVDSAAAILEHLGRRVVRQDDSLVISGTLSCNHIPENLMRRMRSSVVFLGAILTRTGRAKMTYPGGCELGPRPIDIHLEAFRSLGAVIHDESDYLECFTNGLRGVYLRLRFPSVGATENAMIAATLADGQTIIDNAAREPEIADLARFLRTLGADVHGENSSSILVRGVKRCHGGTYRVAADRIAAGTYLCAAAITGGKISVKGVQTSELATLCNALGRAGCEINTESDRIRLYAPEKLRAIPQIVTEPYPGFPTDLQAPLMAALTKSEGETQFDERIFLNRYRHVPDLIKMGADIRINGAQAIVHGVPILHGAAVRACELRGGAALVVAALAADSPSCISGMEHIERGYENIDSVLRSLGISAYLHESSDSPVHVERR